MAVNHHEQKRIIGAVEVQVWSRPPTGAGQNSSLPHSDLNRWAIFVAFVYFYEEERHSLLHLECLSGLQKQTKATKRT